MGLKFGFLLILMSISYASEARNLGMSNVIYLVEATKSHIQSKIAEINVGDDFEPFCKLCEDYASQALEYLSTNETQTEILSTLYEVCSSLDHLEKECLYLVDHYVTWFFDELSEIEPDDVCEKTKLCKEDISLRITENSETCTLCHNVVVEALLKLKDPDTQLEIVKKLIKSCNKMENYVQQCKKLVLQYFSFILLNAETILETNDVCTTIHACQESQAVSTIAVAAA